MTKDDGGSAFPSHGSMGEVAQQGMTLKDYFAAKALSNSVICTGSAASWELSEWFGNGSGITRQQIVAKQANSYADAMLAERSK